MLNLDQSQLLLNLKSLTALSGKSPSHFTLYTRLVSHLVWLCVKFLLKILIVCVQSVHSNLYQDEDLTDSGIFSLFQTAYDIHCWVGKSASSELYKRGLYNAIALDDAVIAFILSSVFIHLSPQCSTKCLAAFPVHTFHHGKVISFYKVP